MTAATIIAGISVLSFVSYLSFVAGYGYRDGENIIKETDSYRKVYLEGYSDGYSDMKQEIVELNKRNEDISQRNDFVIYNN